MALIWERMMSDFLTVLPKLMPVLGPFFIGWAIFMLFMLAFFRAGDRMFKRWEESAGDEALAEAKRISASANGELTHTELRSISDAIARIEADWWQGRGRIGVAIRLGDGTMLTITSLSYR